MRKIISIILVVWLIGVLYGLLKPLPENISLESEIYNVAAEDITFLGDRTFLNEEGIRESDQQIFDEVISMIDNAHSYILLDMFLYNDFLGTATSSHRGLTSDLTQALLNKKESNSDIVIQVITDPINEVYGSVESRHLDELREAGINVTVTDLTKLRDSHPLYSSFWRTYIQWFGNSSGGFLPNPFQAGEDKVTVRSFLTLLNYKSNHRKLIIADQKNGDELKMSILVTSANPHDGSSAHSNVALKIDSKIWQDALVSEKAVIDFSGGDFIDPVGEITDSEDGDVQVQFLTEGKIGEAIVDEIDLLEQGDTLDMAMFYIADRQIVKALKEADKRDVAIRLLLDPNKDAFGREKTGIPNRQVAHELMSDQTGNISVRWCDTHGEQCHSKLLITQSGDTYSMFVGSANFTRRNVRDYNLETDVLVRSTGLVSAISDAKDFFDDRWGNGDGKIYSTDYSSYADDSFVKTIRYRIKEWSGVSRW